MKLVQSRRNFLVRSAKGGLLVFAASSLGPTLLSGCKKNQAKESGNDVAAKETKIDASSCSGQGNLTEQEKSIRASLKYVDQTPIAARTCDNCKLYTQPLNNALCGGCKVVPGPIHPQGYCTAWIPLM